MAKDKKKGKGAPANNAGRPTGTYNSYATTGYGNSYGYGGGAYNRTPYNGAYGNQVPQANPANGANVTNINNSTVQGNTKVEKVDLAKTGKSKGKQKKLAKKAAKFDETDLRCYPMTVRAWIGTFILLAIPLIGGICAICWFFGVGNKSRTSWIRAYVVISLIIVIILGILLGVGYSLLSKSAKNEGYEGFNETIYYGASKLLDMVGEMIGSTEQVQGIKDWLADILNISTKKVSDADPDVYPDAGNGGETGSGAGGVEIEEQYA